MPRPRTDIRPRILAAARERFAQSGVDASSLRGIAADAGTSIGMIYYYFPTKDELFLAVVEDVYAQLLAELEAALSAEPDYSRGVLALYRRIALATAVELQVIRLVAREALTSTERLASLARRFSRGHVPLILGAALAGVRSGELRADVHPLTLLAATIALGTLPQVALRAISQHLPMSAPDPEALTLELARVLMQGIGARGAR